MIFVQLIKKLRQKTGAGFLDCKKALEASKNNIDQAIKWLQKNGIAIAIKKAGVVANEGIIAIKTKNNVFVMYEVNCQTDFVAKNLEFKNLVKKIGDALVNEDFDSIEEANLVVLDKNKTIRETIIETIAKIGEKIELRRVVKVIKKREGQALGTYVHTNKKIGAIVITTGGNDNVARNVAMHVASMNPQFLDKSMINPKIIANIKKEINKAKILKGKPNNIKENIVAGMLKKELSKITLVDQEFVMEKISVSKYLANEGAIAKTMHRFELGEEIEKQEQNLTTKFTTPT